MNELNQNQSTKYEIDDEDQMAYDTELNLMTQDSGIFKDLRLKMKKLVHSAVQTLESSEMH